MARAELWSGVVEMSPCAFSLKHCCEVEGTGRGLERRKEPGPPGGCTGPRTGSGLHHPRGNQARLVRRMSEAWACGQGTPNGRAAQLG